MPAKKEEAMKNIKFSLIDNDFVVQAETEIDVNEKQNKKFIRFLRQLKEELVIGQTAHFEVEGLQGNPVSFTITSC